MRRRRARRASDRLGAAGPERAGGRAVPQYLVEVRPPHSPEEGARGGRGGRGGGRGPTRAGMSRARVTEPDNYGPRRFKSSMSSAAPADARLPAASCADDGSSVGRGRRRTPPDPALPLPTPRAPKAPPTQSGARPAKQGVEPAKRLRGLPAWRLCAERGNRLYTPAGRGAGRRGRKQSTFPVASAWSPRRTSQSRLAHLSVSAPRVTPTFLGGKIHRRSCRRFRRPCTLLRTLRTSFADLGGRG